MHRSPSPRHDPAVLASAAGRPGESTGPDLGVAVPGPRRADRLEAVRGQGPRHRAPLEPRPPRTPTADHLLVVLALAVTALLVAGVGLPAPAAAGVLVVGLSCVGGPLLRVAGIALPDPLARFVLGVAGGVVVVAGLLRLVDAVGWTPPVPATALGGLVLVVVGRFTGPRARGPLEPARLRRTLGLLPLAALPALAWIDASSSPSRPGWLRSAVLVAGLVLLARLSLPQRHGSPRRVRRASVAATLYALALAVLTPFAGTSPTPWSTAAARLFALSGADTSRIVLPAVTALVVVAAWLAAERVLGPSPAVVAATLALALLVTTPPGWGDLAVGSAALLVVTGRGTRDRRALRGRRALVLTLGAGALLAGPSATVFAAQVCLATLVTVLPRRARRGRRSRRGRRTVLTPVLALALAGAAWVAVAVRHGLTLGGGPVTPIALVLGVLAAVGLLSAAFRAWARAPWRDGEFLLLAAAGLLVQTVAAVAGPDPARSAVTQVLLVLAVPATLGVRALWSVLAGALGLVLDRVPGRWLRSGARATRAHRLSPPRAARTALVALALFALVYAGRAFG